MSYLFKLDKRLGIPLPSLIKEWNKYSKETQAVILLEWEQIRGKIPDRIHLLEKEINIKQAQLEVEEDFKHSCLLNFEIAELASIINDLWIWFRTRQDVSSKIHQ
ncbi:hypothetical protein [Bacillus taeanensis]|uniref:Uncharacterized protein n=1 Tax=Bacillus taeanensis TaxID=273032 RepID=A0A366Y0V9_9BACI|nr:hypothetical protein [Bacillus taeanensis]RBW71468.1 hypothetical protein DS031_01595 [Bacillus taeanensis]